MQLCCGGEFLSRLMLVGFHAKSMSPFKKICLHFISETLLLKSLEWRFDTRSHFFCALLGLHRKGLFDRCCVTWRLNKPQQLQAPQILSTGKEAVLATVFAGLISVLSSLTLLDSVTHQADLAKEASEWGKVARAFSCASRLDQVTARHSSAQLSEPSEQENRNACDAMQIYRYPSIQVFKAQRSS